MVRFRTAGRNTRWLQLLTEEWDAVVLGDSADVGGSVGAEWTGDSHFYVAHPAQPREQWRSVRLSRGRPLAYARGSVRAGLRYTVAMTGRPEESEAAAYYFTYIDL